MDKQLFNDIVNFLIPHMTTQADQQALVQQALFNHPVLAQIQYGTAANVFTTQLVQKLIDYGELDNGKLAIVALLELVKNRVGLNGQEQADELIRRIREAKDQSTESDKDDSIQEPSSEKSSRLFVLAFLFTLLIVAAIVLGLTNTGMLDPSTPTPEATITPTNTLMPETEITTDTVTATDTPTSENPPPPTTIGISIISSGQDDLTIYFSESKSITGLTLVTTDETISLEDTFEILQQQNNQVTAPTCLRFVQFDKTPPLAEQCQAPNTLNLKDTRAPANVFWFDFLAGSLKDIILKQGDTLIGTCSPSAQPKCDF